MPETPRVCPSTRGLSPWGPGPRAHGPWPTGPMHGSYKHTGLLAYEASGIGVFLNALQHNSCIFFRIARQYQLPQNIRSRGQRRWRRLRQKSFPSQPDPSSAQGPGISYPVQVPPLHSLYILFHLVSNYYVGCFFGGHVSRAVDHMGQGP